ncbi:MAG: hypothetical protein HS127_18845 [Planctomycetia bacterium]|nr:hypothetical protein [Planctomycetia bacterium]
MVKLLEELMEAMQETQWVKEKYGREEEARTLKKNAVIECKRMCNNS